MIFKNKRNLLFQVNPAIHALSFVLALVMVCSASAMEFDGEIRDIASDTLLYKLKSEMTQTPEMFSRKNSFSNLEGEVLVTEEATSKNNVPVSYHIEQLQTKEKGTVTVEGDKVKYSFTNSDGKVKTAEEKLAANFVVGPLLVPYLQQHWDEVIKGEKVIVMLGVWFRTESVEFRMYKTKEIDYKGRPSIEVVMNPTSWFIRKLVDDLIFTFDKSTKQLVALKGRVPPKKKSGDKLKDLDALTIYNVDLK